MSPRARVALAVGLLLLAHGAAALSPARLWGLSFVAWLPPMAWVGFGLFSALLLWPRSRAALGTLAARLPDPWRRSPTAVGFWVAALLAAGLAFVLLRSAVHLLGDGDLYIREMNRDAWAQGSRIDRAPLTFWLLRRIYLVAHRWGADGETVYRTLSVVSGLLYVATAGLLAGLLGRRRGERLALWAFLVTGGYMALFFGYVENYGVLLLALSIYLAAGLLAVQGRVGSWLPALVLGVLLPLHVSLAVFLPSLAVLIAVEARRPGRRAARALGSLAVLVVVSGGLLLGAVREPLALFRGVHRSNLLPLVAAPDQAQHYRLLSLEHGLDVLNLLLLVVPGTLLVLLAAGRRPGHRDPEPLFLGVAALSGLALAAVLNPEVGFFRDWDVLALLLYPLAVWGGWLLVRSATGASADTALLIVGAALLHTALWVGVNARAESATDRFRALLTGAPLSLHARSYGWETLGTLYDHTGRPQLALAAFEEANRASGGNPRHWVSLGAIHLGAGRYDDAVAAYERAIQKAPERFEAYLGLARAYLRSGRPREALRPLERALQLAPGDPEVWFETGNAAFDLGENERALEAYERTISLAPRSVDARVNRASALYALGRHEAAVQAAADALELSPDSPEALYIQGTGLWALGRREEARQSFQRLLEVAPTHPHAERVRRLLAP